MKGPRRLLHEDPGFARLIDAVRRDAPSEAQMSKALSLASTVAALPGSGSFASWLGRASTKIGFTILVGVGAILASLAASSVTDDQATAPSAAPLPSLTVALVQPASVNAPSEAAVASVRVDDLPSAPVVQVAPAVQAPAHAKRAEPTPADAGSTFSAELALTSEARAALERGDVLACLSAVDRYQRTFRSGVFAQEIDVIHIEALAKSGERERAHASAERFLATNPTSPYADRVRSVLENTK
ncbi:MAG: hypothetical protein JWO86_4033 [Myxococcaceae bacterium]|nr:hypothetical protein [Myxococcaceae bacterium]